MPCRALDPGNETAQNSRRPVVPSSSKPHAPYDREENRNGKFRQRLQASDGLTRKLIAAVCSPRRSLEEAGKVNPRAKERGIVASRALQRQRLRRRTLAARDKQLLTVPIIGDSFLPLSPRASSVDTAVV